MTNSQKEISAEERINILIEERNNKQPYTEQKISRDGMGWYGMGWDGMGWDGMGQDRNELELDRINHIRAPAICSPLLRTPITERFRGEHHAQQSLLI